jgi:predicted phosphodiesterase
MTKTDVARQYRDKYPDWPSLKLARVMYTKEPLMFNNVEHARKFLRAIEGKAGRGQFRIKPTHHAEPRPYNPYKLPESDESKYHPFVLRGHKRILGLFDIHAPYHSITAITAALDYAKKEKPDAVLIGGDLFDFHGLSKFIKDPRKKNFAEELNVGVELIQAIQRTIKAPIYFKLGNHDERYQHYLWMKMGELHGVEDFELKTILGRRVSDMTIIDEKRVIRAGDLNVVHGHEFASSIISPVNIARGLYLRAKASSICGHHHRSSEHTEQDINGKIVTTWSVGCLSELHPQYMPINSWNHGFVLIDLHGSKDFEVRNKRIWKGQIL